MTETPHRPAAAAALILTAMAMMGLVDNAVPVIADTAGLWQFQVIRSAMAMAMLTVVARLCGWRLMPRRWGPVVGRSLLLSSALIVYFAALAVLPISEAIAGLFTAPIFVLLMSVGLFGQAIGRVRILAILGGFVGVLLVLRPEAGALTWLSALPVCAGVLYALAQLATRQWCSGEGALTLLYGFFAGMGAWGVVGLAVLAATRPEVPPGAVGWTFRLWGELSAAAWGWTVAQAVFSLVAVGFITRAYQIGEASYVAAYEYALLIFAVLWGWMFFGTSVDAAALAGIALIVVSGAVIALRGSTTAPRPAPTAP